MNANPIEIEVQEIGKEADSDQEEAVHSLTEEMTEEIAILIEGMEVLQDITVAEGMIIIHKCIHFIGRAPHQGIEKDLDPDREIVQEVITQGTKNPEVSTTVQEIMQAVIHQTHQDQMAMDPQAASVMKETTSVEMGLQEKATVTTCLLEDLREVHPEEEGSSPEVASGTVEETSEALAETGTKKSRGS
jgi:hypothetical protein